MVSASYSGIDCEIQSKGGVRGKDDRGRVRDTEKTGDLATRVVDRLGCKKRERVRTSPGVAADPLDTVGDGAFDRARLRVGRRGVVEIDHPSISRVLIPIPACERIADAR